ncbi:MAG: hypothetical protein J0626_06270, partial [Rhodospirillaceae bacterium]|nr:hypothetical protein [Rhodospirillaceae bacterium]
LFVSEYIPIAVKAPLLGEVLKSPPLIRKELITNLLSSPKAPRELIDHARGQLAYGMSRAQVTEIVLFTMLKQSWQAQKLAPGRPTI